MRKDKVVNDNTGGKISMAQKRTTDEGGEELWGRGENRKTNFQGMNKYKGLRQTGAGTRNGVRCNDTEKVHGDHAPLKQADRFQYRVRFRKISVLDASLLNRRQFYD